MNKLEKYFLLNVSTLNDVIIEAQKELQDLVKMKDKQSLDVARETFDNIVPVTHFKDLALLKSNIKDLHDLIQDIRQTYNYFSAPLTEEERKQNHDFLINFYNNVKATQVSEE